MTCTDCKNHSENAYYTQHNLGCAHCAARALTRITEWAKKPRDTEPMRLRWAQTIKAWTDWGHDKELILRLYKAGVIHETAKAKANAKGAVSAGAAVLGRPA